jgi:hypothetical protein
MLAQVFAIILVLKPLEQYLKVNIAIDFLAGSMWFQSIIGLVLEVLTGGRKLGMVNT